jgi:hypothetical protein
MKKYEKFKNEFQSAVDFNLNNQAHKNFQHHISVFGGYITGNNTDQPQ